jgi:hypothetical protein
MSESVRKGLLFVCLIAIGLLFYPGLLVLKKPWKVGLVLCDGFSGGDAWVDRDGNGRREPDEPGLEGVSIWVPSNQNCWTSGTSPGSVRRPRRMRRDFGPGSSSLERHAMRSTSMRCPRRGIERPRLWLSTTAMVSLASPPSYPLIVDTRRRIGSIGGRSGGRRCGRR